MAILFLFFCSGATALVYEVIWSKYLALLFGSTIQAQTIVLAVFMGGLALGNKLFGVRADRARQPLAIYGWIEIAIGLYAVLFTFIYRAADALFVSVGSSILDQPGLLLLLKGGISFALLLGPTILMGGTLPVLAAWLQQNTEDAGRRSARFYSTNSLGAVFGAGLAGFFLVQRFGMPQTLLLTGLVNIVVGVVAIVIGRRPAVLPLGIEGASGVAASSTESTAKSPILLWGCILVATTGAVSMGLEVLASRCLALIFGSSLQVFAIVLMAFILGIGLGSAVIASPRFKRLSGELTTIILLLCVAGLIGLLVYNIENLVQVYRYARSGLSRSSIGYRFYQMLTSVVSIGVLGIPAAGLGAVLPLWIRVLSDNSVHLGNRVGRLLTWNTLGAVGGVLLTGFVFMPGIGLRSSFAVLGLVLVAAAIFTALAMRRRFAAILGVVVAALLLFVATTGNESWRYIFSSGVFRWHDTDDSLKSAANRKDFVDLVFYEDAADATVSVECEKPRAEMVTLRINGKPDASSRGDLPTQIYVGQIPMLAKPESKDVFVLGFGSGITGATLLGYPIERLTIAENCEPVLRAARFFDRWNHVVLTNSRVRIYREDARTVLKLSPEKYDVIVAEPSNPWTVGVGSVFSQEFYQFAANRLKPGGIMAQWFHTYEMEDAIVFMVVRTFATVFPHMEIWDVGGGDILMLGAEKPWKSDLDIYRRAFQLEGPRADLAAVGYGAPEVVLARQVASQRTAWAIGGPGPIQTDARPILEYDAPRAFYMGGQAQGLGRYDERTWQMDLASLDKNEVLASLDGAILNLLFQNPCPSWNMQLQGYVEMRAPGHQAPANNPLLAVPCIFQGTNDLVLYVPPIHSTNGIIQRLCNAELTLRTTLNAEMTRPAVEEIKQILDSIPASELTDPVRKADYYADVGIKGSLHLGDKALARAILLRGLELEPGSQQLRYLARILVREGVVTEAELPPVKRPAGPGGLQAARN